MEPHPTTPDSPDPTDRAPQRPRTRLALATALLALTAPAASAQEPEPTDPEPTDIEEHVQQSYEELPDAAFDPDATQDVIVSLTPGSGLSAAIDAATNYGSEIGYTYQLDLFFAERHKEMSNFRIETSIGCLVAPPVD